MRRPVRPSVWPYLLAGLVAVALALAVVNAGESAPSRQTVRVYKSQSVLRFFANPNHRWIVAPTHQRCATVPWTRSCLIGRERVRFHERRLASLIPRGEAALRAYIDDPCLAEIVDRETAGTWSPTVYNYQGSGAYGLPQALPGHKMASAGADWRTDPRVQIAWMRRYVVARYGGSCAALSHHNERGWY